MGITPAWGHKSGTPIYATAKKATKSPTVIDRTFRGSSRIKVHTMQHLRASFFRQGGVFCPGSFRTTKKLSLFQRGTNGWAIFQSASKLSGYVHYLTLFWVKRNIKPDLCRWTLCWDKWRFLRLITSNCDEASVQRASAAIRARQLLRHTVRRVT